MTAPRIIPAAEAEGLLRHGTDAELAAAAPDLAASVVKLHALLAYEKARANEIEAENAALKNHTKQLQTLLDEAYDFLNARGKPAWDDWCDRLCEIDFEVAP